MNRQNDAAAHRNDRAARATAHWRPLRPLAALVALTAVVCIIAVGVPYALRRYARDDLRGALEQTAAGHVVNQQLTPGNPGGGGAFNAVTLSFAGRMVYWPLPPSSRWDPQPGEPVLVPFRVGRYRSHAG